MKYRWPDHMKKSYGTPAEFRKIKRKQVREAYAAVHELLIGCAFTPAGRNISTALEALLQAKEQLSVKNFHKQHGN